MKEKEIKLYMPESQELILAVEGTGDNLTEEDQAEGYVDYIMVEMYKLDGTDVESTDGGQIMLTKLVADMTHEEFKQAVLDFWGYGKQGFEAVKEL